METLIKCLGIIGVLLVIVFLSTIILYFVYPWIIPAVFPGLVAKGYIAAKLTFWQYWGLSLMCGLLFRIDKSK